MTGLFGAVAVATQHEHWLKDPGEVEPIVGPLCRIIEELPAKSLKAFEKHFNKAALAAGTLVLVGTDLTAEIKLRKEENASRAEEERGVRSKPKPRPVNPEGKVRGGDGQVPGSDAGKAGVGAPDWTATLPESEVQTDYGLPNP